MECTFIGKDARTEFGTLVRGIRGEVEKAPKNSLSAQSGKPFWFRPNGWKTPAVGVYRHEIKFDESDDELAMEAFMDDLFSCIKD